MKFLVIQTRDIGDVMLSTALCNSLKQGFPDAKVDMLTMDYCSGVVEGNPNIDEILILKKSQRNKLSYVINFLKQIRAKKYDVILNVQGQLVGLLTCLFSAAPKRIGFDKFPWSLAHSDNVPFPCPHEPSGEGYTIDDRFTLLDPLAINTEDRSYKIWLSEDEKNAAHQAFVSAGIDMSKPIIAFGINSRDDYKQWPIEYFAQLAEWFIDCFDINILIFFGPGEETYSQGLKPLLPKDKQQYVYDNVKTSSIRELAALFSQCALYVGNDTGPRHIAQAIDLPAFAIVSPASNKRGWIPWNNPRFRAVEPADALGLSIPEWDAICENLTPGVNDAEWFEKLSVEYVQSQLKPMIEELHLFSSTKSK
jgi:heptosyltransferase III